MTFNTIINSFSRSPISYTEWDVPQDPLINKVKKVVAVFFFGLAYIIFLPLTIGLGIFRLYTYFSTKDIINSQGKSRFDAIRKFIHENKPKMDTDPLDGKARKELSLALYEASKLLEKDPGNHYHDHLQNVREKVDYALSLPAYRKNKDKENKVIQSLQLIAHALTAEASGMEEFRRHGKEAVGKLFTSDYSTLATSLDQAVRGQKTFQKKHIGKFFWILAHPFKAAHSLFDHLGLTPAMAYNSYREGNASVKVGTFHVGNHNMHLSLGPTPTCDRLFLAHLDYLRRTGRSRFQQDLESTRGSEGKRVAAKKAMAAACQDIVTYLSTPIDTPYWKGKGTEMKSGLEIPASFDPEGLKKITEQAFANSNVSNRAKLLAYETALAIQGIIKTTKNDSYMGQACKQDIDRGVLLNVMTILFADAISGKKLTEERIHELIGVVLLRPSMVDDRGILPGRYAALSELLHHIAKDPEKFYQPYRNYFKPSWLLFRPRITFEAEKGSSVQSEE